jgi:hypothetical protein
MCGLAFNTPRDLITHRKTHQPPTTFVHRKRALHGAARSFELDFTDDDDSTNNLGHIMRDHHDTMMTLLRTELNKCPRQKVAIVILCHISRPDTDGNASEDELFEFPFQASSFEATLTNDLSANLHNSFSELTSRMTAFHVNGSSWTVMAIQSLRLEFAICKPLNGSCNLNFVCLPSQMSKSKILKTESVQRDCFYKAVASHFVSGKNSIRQFIRKNMTRVRPSSHAVQVKDFQKFEKKNPDLSLRLNCLYKEGENIFPILTSTNMEGKNTINILLYKCVQNGHVTPHYTRVSNLEKFLRVNYRGADNKKSYQRCNPCPNCLQKLSSASLLHDHMLNCSKNKPVKLTFPDESEKIEFMNFTRKFKRGIIGFFDMETTTTKPKKECHKCDDKIECPHKSKVHANQNAMSYSLIILNHDYDIILQRHFVGVDCIDDLQRTLHKARKLIDSIVKDSKKMIFTKRDNRRYKAAATCHICEKKLWEAPRCSKKIISDSDSVTVRGHCHLTGKCLGAAHNICNLLRPESNKVPIYCHFYKVP